MNSGEPSSPTRGGYARWSVRDGDVIRSRLAPVGARETIGAMLARNATRLADHPAYAERRHGEFQMVTWSALCRDACAFGAFLTASGVRPGDRVVVVSPNRGEMLIIELATMSIGAVYVPIFAGYAAVQTAALLGHARPTVVVLPDAIWLARVMMPPTVRVVVAFGTSPMATGEWRVSGAVPVVQFDDVLAASTEDSGDAAGQGFLERAARGDPDAPCLMMYTSGTSGALKGVVLTHDNILSQRHAIAAIGVDGGIWQVTPSDRLLSYLPWHHSFGGIFEKYTALYNGATIFIDDSLGKDFETLRTNWLVARPTIYFSVPKVYQQLVARAQSDAADERRIFHQDLRFVFTAAAPLPANISAFFAARQIPVVEGWGLTETSPCCTLTDPTESRTVLGMVGYPIPGVEVRVAADGEILVRGPNVMCGYFDDPASTAVALPGDGWFHTGDLGELSGSGLRLVARKDRVFKMLNAEKVVPTQIEDRLAGMNKYIRHVIVAGAGRGFLSAIVFPDFFRIAEEFGDDHAAAGAAVKASLRETVLEFNRTHPVKYERIQAVTVVSKELSIEDQELTPSLKLRVHNVLLRSQEYLEAVYEPTPRCSCRVLRKVLRIGEDSRPCVGGLDRTLDRCHECGSFIFDDVDDRPMPVEGLRA